MIRLAVRVAGAHAELVLAELLELAPSGVEEVPAIADEGVVEYAIYGAPGELPELPDLQAAAGHALVEVVTSELPDDWSERWRQFHRPVLVPAPAGAGLPGNTRPGPPDLLVRPPWEHVEPAGSTHSVAEIVIDPGQAFGTGAHATTRLCLELLLELAASEGEENRGALLDVGTGSGVLAIAAAKLAFAPVLALDHERESVAAARENAAVNGVTIDVRRADLRTEGLPPARVVLANLLRPLLVELAAKLPGTPRHLIAGGLLREEADEVSRAFARRLRLGERERRERGGWAALWLSAA